MAASSESAHAASGRRGAALPQAAEPRPIKRAGVAFRARVAPGAALKPSGRPTSQSAWSSDALGRRLRTTRGRKRGPRFDHPLPNMAHYHGPNWAKHRFKKKNPMRPKKIEN